MHVRGQRHAFIVGLLLTAAMCVAQEPANRAPNPGFERADGDAPAGWKRSVIKGDGVKLDHIESPLGGRCVSIETAQPDVKAGWTTAERIALVPGAKLSIAMKVKLEDLRPGPGGGEGFVITCHFYDQAAYLTWAHSAGTMESRDWHEESLACSAPTGAVYVVLGFRLSGCTGRALVDEVRLHTQKPTRPEQVKPYGLQPGDPAAKLAVALITGDDITSPASHQIIDLLNREGIATAAFDAVNIEQFPATADGLGRFAAIFVGALNPQTGAGLLTEAQAAAAREYVNRGGGIVAWVAAVAGTVLAECFAADIGEGVRGWHFLPETTDATHPVLADITFPWPGFGFKMNETTFYQVQVREGAQVLAMVPEEVAGAGVPFLLCNACGAGQAVLMNSTWTGNVGGEFVSWRCAPRLLAQAARWAAGMEALALADKTPLPDPREPTPYGGRWHGAAPPEQPHLPDPATLPEATLTLDPAAPIPPVEEPITQAAAIEEGADAVVVTFANGVRLTMHRTAQVELRAPDGTSLTAEPADEQPLIATSGTEATDLIVDLEAGAAEPQIFKQPIEKSKLLARQYTYQTCERGEGGSVTFVFELETEAAPATLRWSFTPRTVQMEGRSWAGVGDRYEVISREHFIDSVMGKYPWRIGGTVADDRTMRLACYSQPRGYYEMPLDISRDSGPHNAWSFFASGQPFHVLGGEEGTLLLYYDAPTQIRGRAVIVQGRDAVYFDNRVVIGRRRGTISTPIQWMLFSKQRLSRGLWMQLYDHIKGEYAQKYGVSQTRPLPCGQMRLESLGTGGAYRGRNAKMGRELNLREIADYFVPLAAERGIRRLDVGSIVNPEHPLDPDEHPEKFAAVKYLIDKAHSLGIECFIYWRITFWNRHAPLVVAHPEWYERKRDGTAFSVGSLVNLSLRSGWYDWSLSRLKELKEQLGIDGMWFDSLAPAMDCVNYAEQEPQPVVQRGIEYFREVREAGLDFWVEGMHPLALDSFWYRKEKYGGPFEEREFCLFNSSMYAHGPDSLIYLEPFRLVAFRAPMMADVRELTVADDPIVREQARCNRIFNAADEALGEIRAVRCTDLGSLWIGERGYAVFAFEDRRVSIEGLAGNGWQVTIPEGRGGRLAYADSKVSGYLLAGEAAVISR